jgi:hypothetical protein
MSNLQLLRTMPFARTDNIDITAQACFQANCLTLGDNIRRLIDVPTAKHA